MTRYDYHIVMRRVKTAELKARLSEYLRAVRQGEQIEVLDRETPIARLVPLDKEGIDAGGLRILPARVKGGLKGFKRPTDPVWNDVDYLAMLREDRDKR